MWSFKNAVKGKATAMDFRSAIEEAETALEDAKVAVVDMNGRRGGVLLDGDDAAVDKFEVELHAKERDVERLDVALDALKGRLDEAEKAAAKTALDARFAAAESARDRGVELIAAYGEHAEVIAEGLAELKAATEFIRIVNAEFEDAGDPRRIERPNRVARKATDKIVNGQVIEAAFEGPELFAAVVLPRAVPHPAKNVWPPQDPEAAEAATAIGEERLRAVAG